MPWFRGAMSVGGPYHLPVVDQASRSPDSYLAGAGGVSTGTRELLRGAETLGLRGRSEQGMAALDAMLDRIAQLTDTDLLAMADLAVLLARWGGSGAVARRVCDAAIHAATEADARAWLLLARGRVAASTDERERYHALALGEFAACEDDRGRALALGKMSGPTDALSAPSLEDRERLGIEGLALALETGDPYVVAVCANNLAGAETCLGRPTALSRWEQAASYFTTAPGLATAEQVVLTHLNWAIIAAAFGDYPQAERALGRGRSFAYSASWQSGFDAIEAYVLLRRGELERARTAADRVRNITQHWAGAVAELVRAAYMFERDRRLPVDDFTDAIASFADQNLHELDAWGRALQARIRSARGELAPHRDLLPALAETRRRGLHVAWEDLLLALARLDVEQARTEAAAMGGLWPPGDRSLAIRHFVDGLLAGDAGFEQLCAAGLLLQSIGEPITAAHALHVAALVAPSAAEGNTLRTQATELLRAAGADRSLAAVVRDRRQHRGRGHTPVPESQRRQVNPGLTPREQQIAVLAAEGLTAQEIADKLHISIGTARNHLLAARTKLGGTPKRELYKMLQPTPKF